MESSIGIPILEVLEFKYLGFSPVKPENQVGTIFMVANDTLYYLYDQSEVDMNKPPIQYGDQIRVNDVGPICNFTDLDMEFDLFRGAYKGFLSISDEYTEGVGKRDCLVKSRTYSVDGCADISLLCGYSPRATVANFEVVLSHVPADATANVFGVVTAKNTKFDYTSTLFFRDSANAIKVGNNGVIPLSKQRLGLPLDSRLIVDIWLFRDGHPYKATAYFTPGIQNQSSYDVIDGRIKVKVTWNWNKDDDSDSDSDSHSQSRSEVCEENSDNDTLESILTMG